MTVADRLARRLRATKAPPLARSACAARARLARRGVRSSGGARAPLVRSHATLASRGTPERAGSERLSQRKRGNQPRTHAALTPRRTEHMPGDTPHPMGAFYLASWYKNTRAQVREYLGEESLFTPGGDLFETLSVTAARTDELKSQPKAVRTVDEWLFADYEAVTLPDRPDLWQKLPDRLQQLPFIVDVRKYRALHESLLGVYDYHGLPPRPTG